MSQSVLTAGERFGNSAASGSDAAKILAQRCRRDGQVKTAEHRVCWRTTRSSKCFLGRLRWSDSNWGGLISLSLRTIAVRELDDDGADEAEP